MKALVSRLVSAMTIAGAVLAAVPAQAHDRDDGWRGDRYDRGWHDRDWHDRDWRDHRWRGDERRYWRGDYDRRYWRGDYRRCWTDWRYDPYWGERVRVRICR